MTTELDRILEEIESLQGGGLKKKRNEYLQKIIQIKELSSIDLSQQILFRSTNTPLQKQFIAACLIRLAHHSESSIWDEIDFRHKVFTLFDEQLKELYEKLKISGKENHEKLSCLKEIEKNLFDEFKSLNAGISSLKVASESQKAIMQALRKPANKIIIDNFVEPSYLISEERLRELFNSLKSYEEASGTSRIEMFKSVDDVFTKYVRDVERCPSKVAVICLKDLFSKIHQLIVDDFQKSDIIKPAKVTLVHPNRKYPFHKINKKIDLKFVIENEGLGYAFNVKIEVLLFEGLESDYSETVASEIKIESIPVVLPVKANNNELKHSLLVRWTWQNYDNSISQNEFLFEFESQREDIDWENLKYKSPYNLHAVSSEEELVGRKELVENIYGKLISESIESCMIFGQKRVGKTSIAQTLESKILRGKKLFPIFIKVGDLSKTSSHNFISTLGEAIVEATLYSNELNNFVISKPEFKDSLSPKLPYYFKNIKRLSPNLKFVIIIDEFDEIPVELYPYTEAGDSFFHNLRSLSQEGSQIGFILIGGENMQKIRESTDKLNLFTPCKVDYFDKEKFFNDFKDLIKQPVQNILDFSDESIEEIYKFSEGNPFFTKFICSKLFKNACDRNDSYISIDETKSAILESIESIDLINVTHFWIDGISEKQQERKDQIETQRRKFLIAYAEVRRNNSRVTKENISKSKILNDVAVDSMIENFTNRGILIESKNGEVRLKPRLFDEWLVQRGSQLLTSSFADANAIEELRSKEDKAFVKDKEIIELISKWNLYQGKSITTHHVRAWLEQFTNNIERRLMFKLLQSVSFYSEEKIRERLTIIHKYVRQGMTSSIKEGERSNRAILLSSFDNPAKSSSSYARLYASENKIFSENVSSLEDIDKFISKDKEKRITRLVFIDDIVGSGNTIIEGLQDLNRRCGETLKSSDIRVIVANICGLESGRESIEAIKPDLYFDFDIYICDVLNNSDRCFSEESSIFTLEERKTARDIVQKYGSKLQKKQPLGYADGQLLIVFRDTCPNNSLPILWDKKEFWMPLFRRH
jgi:hypothetical protein